MIDPQNPKTADRRQDEPGRGLQNDAAGRVTGRGSAEGPNVPDAPPPRPKRLETSPRNPVGISPERRGMRRGEMLCAGEGSRRQVQRRWSEYGGKTVSKRDGDFPVSPAGCLTPKPPRVFPLQHPPNALELVISFKSRFFFF